MDRQSLLYICEDASKKLLSTGPIITQDDYTSLAKMLTDKIGHMGQMLTFVSEVFSGDKAADFLKNSIIR